MTLIEELKSMGARLDRIATKLDDDQLGDRLYRLEKACAEFGRASSGSWLGYHSCVYYQNFEPPEPGDTFSVEWGLNEDWGSGGGPWRVWDGQAVRDALFKKAKEDEGELGRLRRQAKKVRQEIDEIRLGMLSITSRLSESNPKDTFLVECQKQLKASVPISSADIVKAKSPKGQVMTRDSLALTGGYKAPPHVEVFAEMLEVRSTYARAEDLAALARSLAAHFERAGTRPPAQPSGDKAPRGHTIKITGPVHGGLQIDSHGSVQTNATQASVSVERNVQALKDEVLKSPLSDLEKEEVELALDRIVALSKRPRTEETAKALGGKFKDVKSAVAAAGDVALSLLKQIAEVVKIN